jgi:uncharacterized membrane protein
METATSFSNTDHACPKAFLCSAGTSGIDYFGQQWKIVAHGARSCEKILL